MRWWMAGCALLGGCDGCQFEYAGSFPMEVAWMPAEVRPTVSVCDGLECTVVDTEVPPSSVVVEDGWLEGRLAPVKGWNRCRVPPLTVTAEAPGCDGDAVELDRNPLELSEPPVQVEFALACP